MALTSKLSQVVSCVIALVLAAGLVAAISVSHRKSRQKAASLQSRDLRELVTHLRTAGLDLRVVPTEEDGAITHNVFLTTTNQEWKDLNVLAKQREQIASWRGTLYVERGPADVDWSVRLATWGDCCLPAGPFIFFGDPELLARIRTILADRL